MEDDEKSVLAFNRDVSTIPCFRSSFLSGIGAGFTGGLAYFLFTSNTRMATHVGFTSFVVVTMSYWFHCRWQWSKVKFSHGQLQSVMKEYTMYQGTDKDVNIPDHLQKVEN